MTMDAFLEPRHVELRERARRLAVHDLEALDALAEDDVAAASRDAAKRLADAGLFRVVVPGQHGGDAPDVEVRAVLAAREGVAYGSGLADALLALQGLGSLPIALAGTDAQAREWLPKVATGRAIAAFAMTEPAAGSDAAAMTTRARPTDDGWAISGVKTFISNAGLADFYVVFAKTHPDAGAKGISAFLVPADARGLAVEPLRAMAPHPLGTVLLGDVHVPRDALLGEAGRGYGLALATLDRMRPSVAAAACGFACRALDEAARHARSRRQFGAPVGENQGLRWGFADAATDLEAARLLAYRAAWRKDLGQARITVESAQAKLFATEAAQRIVDFALQVHGGAGTMRGAVVERLYREVRALRIYEGTSEILRDVVGRAVLDRSE